MERSFKVFLTKQHTSTCTLTFQNLSSHCVVGIRLFYLPPVKNAIMICTVAVQADILKNTKYAHLDSAYMFVPVAVEMCRYFGPQTKAFFQLLRSATSDKNSYQNVNWRIWKIKFSVGLFVCVTYYYYYYIYYYIIIFTLCCRVITIANIFAYIFVFIIKIHLC